MSNTTHAWCLLPINYVYDDQYYTAEGHGYPKSVHSTREGAEAEKASIELEDLRTRLLGGVSNINEYLDEDAEEIDVESLCQEYSEWVIESQRYGWGDHHCFKKDTPPHIFAEILEKYREQLAVLYDVYEVEFAPDTVEDEE